MSKIALFPGARLTPEVLLARLIENQANFKSIAVMTLDKNDEVDISMSNMAVKDLAYMTVLFVDHVQNVLAGRPVDKQEFFPPETSA